MQPAQLTRINELARKSKAEGLTDAEKQEQQQLRAAYIQAYRNSMRSTLEQIRLVDEDGNETALKQNK